MVEEGGEGRGSTKHTVQRVALRHFITVCHNPGTSKLPPVPVLPATNYKSHPTSPPSQTSCFLSQGLSPEFPWPPNTSCEPTRSSLDPASGGLTSADCTTNGLETSASTLSIYSESHRPLACHIQSFQPDLHPHTRHGPGSPH